MGNIEKLKEEVKKLNQLLEENEQGMGTWWLFIDERIENICKLYYGYVPSVPKF